MPFLRLAHQDTICLIDLIEEIEENERTPQERLTLQKLQMIKLAQEQKFSQVGYTSKNRRQAELNNQQEG